MGGFLQPGTLILVKLLRNFSVERARRMFYLTLDGFQFGAVIKM